MVINLFIGYYCPYVLQEQGNGLAGRLTIKYIKSFQSVPSAMKETHRALRLRVTRWSGRPF